MNEKRIEKQAKAAYETYWSKHSYFPRHTLEFNSNPEIVKTVWRKVAIAVNKA